MKDLFWAGFHDEVVKLSFQRAFAREVMDAAGEVEKKAFLFGGAGIAATLGVAALASAAGLSGVGKPKGVPRSRWFSGSDVGKTFGHFGTLGAAMGGAGAVRGGARLLASGARARSALTAARQAFRPAAFGRAGFSPAARKLTKTLAGSPRVGRLARTGRAAEVGFGGLAGAEIAQMGRRAPGAGIIRPRRISRVGGF